MQNTKASKCQSAGLRKRHTQLHKDGRHLCQDSNQSEATLKQAMVDVLEYAKNEIEKIGGKMEYVTTMSLYDCQAYFHLFGGPEPDIKNKSVSMRPDGGIIFAIIDNVKYPVFIGEDKVQGTNDQRLAEGKKRQSLGNAIERAAKNIRGCEMLCAHMNVFPYVIYASGCDFHNTETISKRIEMMNFGVKNHYFDITPETTVAQLDDCLVNVLNNIKVTKLMGHGIASVFVKAHKWDCMKHGSSRWRKIEIVKTSCHIIKLALESIPKKL
jgi:type II restriction enzyme